MIQLRGGGQEEGKTGDGWLWEQSLLTGRTVNGVSETRWNVTEPSEVQNTLCLTFYLILESLVLILMWLVLKAKSKVCLALKRPGELWEAGDDGVQCLISSESAGRRELKCPLCSPAEGTGKEVWVVMTCSKAGWDLCWQNRRFCQGRMFPHCLQGHGDILQGPE